MLKKSLQYTIYLFSIFFLLMLLYVFFAFLLSRILVDEIKHENQSIECYIVTNGVHTDLVLPLENVIKNWNEVVSYQHTKSKSSNYMLVAFGWGDKGFYLNTPTWNDLTFKTAFSAGFGLSTTAIHTTFYNNLTPSENCVKIKLSPEQYKQLVHYIEQSFQLENNKAIIISTEANYNDNDVFYEALGTYHLFKTCNTWANNGLKAAQKKAALWTPFDSGIFYHYH